MKKTDLSLLIVFIFFSCTKSKDQGISYSKAPISEPTLFAHGIISTEENDEFDICFTPDGKEAYFTRRGKDDGDKQKIYQTKFLEGTWTDPVVADFSTDRDETPFITSDGNTLYFGSEREIPGKPNLGGFDMNVWMVKKEQGTWGQPVPLPEPINDVQVEGENWPSSNNNFLFTPDGKTHYFTTMKRGAKSIALFKTERVDESFSDPQVVTGLFDSDSLWIYSASISPDNKYLIFNSYGAPGGFGGEDLYVSKRTSEGWSKAVNFGSKINSEGEEGGARFSPDGKYFFFTHADNLGNYEYGPWSIYFIETESLELDTLFE